MSEFRRDLSPHEAGPAARSQRARVSALVVGLVITASLLAGSDMVSTVQGAPSDPATVPPPATSPTTEPDTTEPDTTEPETTEPTTTSVPEPEPALEGFALVPMCTPAEDFVAGTRLFRVLNNTGEPVEVTLRNLDLNQSISGTAAVGSSLWRVPAGGAANTTELLVAGQTVATSDSSNTICSVLHGNAVCDPGSGSTTITWNVDSNSGAIEYVVSDSRGVEFDPNPHAPFGSAIGTEVITGPATDQRVSETVVVQLSNGATTQQSATVTAGACQGPAFPPEVTFTFTSEADRTTAVLGDTIQYTYCGTNTSDIPLELVRLIDDRLGVILEVPDIQTILQPGDSMCSSELGLAAAYTVVPADLRTTIINNAVVTAQTLETPPREFQASSSTDVEVPLPESVLALLLAETTSRGKVRICHAIGGGRWNPLDVEEGQIINENGHNTDSHENGRDIIPIGTWDADGRNWDAVGEVIWTNSCGVVTVVPQDPVVAPATCAAGVVTPPTVTPQTTTGVTYTVAPPGPYDGTRDTTVTVTATLTIAAYVWGQPRNGWTASGSTFLYSVALAKSSCTTLMPVNPTLIQAECAKGVLSPPTLLLPETDNVAYTVSSPPPYSAGTSVTVTATLGAIGLAWPIALPNGWARTSDTIATYTAAFAHIQCKLVQPETPAVKQATCTNGVVTQPEVARASGPDGVVYVVTPLGPYPTTGTTVVTVTAFVVTDHAWGQMPPGWNSVHPERATFKIELTGASCDAAPVAPTVDEAECVNGAVTEPTMTLPDTDGITYSVSDDGPYAPGDEVTITATLDATGVAWPNPLPTGWQLQPDNTTTHTVTFADVTCRLVPLGNSTGAPTVTHATCVNGSVTAPTIALPSIAGVVLTTDPSGPYDSADDTDVTITATLQDGYAWGNVTNGWSVVDDETATYQVTLAGSTCDEARPVPPTVTQPVCVNGTVAAPALDLATTDGITYTVAPDGPYEPGDQATVTATLDDSDVGWPLTLPDGWSDENDTTATYDVTFDNVTCVPVAPQPLPRVSAVCTADGTVIASLIDLPDTPGMTYSVRLTDPTVATAAEVTATVDGGYGWDAMPDGWTQTSPTSATRTVTLDMVDCTVVESSAPGGAESTAPVPHAWASTSDAAASSASGGNGGGGTAGSSAGPDSGTTAVTGANLSLQSSIAVVMLCVGAMLLLIGRRRVG